MKCNHIFIIVWLSYAWFLVCTNAWVAESDSLSRGMKILKTDRQVASNRERHRGRHTELCVYMYIYISTLKIVTSFCLSVALSLTHVCMHTHTLAHCHTHTHSLSLSHTLVLSLSLSHTHIFSLSLSHTHTLSLSHTHTQTQHTLRARLDHPKAVFVEPYSKSMALSSWYRRPSKISCWPKDIIWIW